MVICTKCRTVTNGLRCNPSPASRGANLPNHTNIMKHIINIKAASSGIEYSCSVPAKWLGKALAVHRPVKDCKTNEIHTKPCYWTITHLETGYAAAIIYKPIQDAVKLAKAWDDAFTDIHSPEDIKEWEWRTEWQYQLNGSSPIRDPRSFENVAQRYDAAA